LYLDQAVFACRIKTHFTMKTSSFYFLYGKHSHLLEDYNATLSVESESALYEERLRLLQSARKDAVIASYERALKNKSARDKLVTPHELEQGQWQTGLSVPKRTVPYIGPSDSVRLALDTFEREPYIPPVRYGTIY